MTFTFTGEIIEWRGPAPFLFVALPEQACRDIKVLSSQLTYGWGCIPARASAGHTSWTTSLFPKDGRYLLGVKVVVQRAENLGLGDPITVTVELG